MTHIYQDDAETLRVTVNGLGDQSLEDATTIEWFLTDDPRTGRGEVMVQTEDVNVRDVEMIDPMTYQGTPDHVVDVRLDPEETAEIDTGTYYHEMTVTWGGEPSTTALHPPLEVRKTSHDAGSS